ncbi:pectinesterase inhibitor-like [Sesamum indicum]|uniref:Pectinesterase inhibitor-like n=1 Tax=Sesamum indicum TaxID=4182 RepID=A0A6I9T9L7_SESIN|nr:pectinesterase inhibitor-like [Sesamum indicum]
MASFSIPPSSLIFLLFSTSQFPLPSTSYPLDNICKQTKNPDFCSGVLGPYSSASLEELARIVIDTTLASATRTSSRIQSLLPTTSDPNLRVVYSLCSNYYSAAISALNAAKDKLKSGDYADLNSAAATVSRDAASCQQTFSLAPSQPVPIATDNNDLDLLSNIFIVVSRILSGSA